MAVPNYIVSLDLSDSTQQEKFEAAAAQNYALSPNNGALLRAFTYSGGLASLIDGLNCIPEGMKFAIDLSSMPVASDQPSFSINGNPVPNIQDPNYYPWMEDQLTLIGDFLEDHDLLSLFTDITFNPVAALPYDGEMGFQMEDKTGRLDSYFAAAGYRPSAFQNSLQSLSTLFTSQPWMASKALRVTCYNPGNWPRVDDTGKVTNVNKDDVFAQSLMQAIVAGRVNNVLLYKADTTFTGQLDAFNTYSAGLMDGLITQFQVDGGSFDQTSFSSAYSSGQSLAKLIRTETHVSEIGFIPQ